MLSFIETPSAAHSTDLRRITWSVWLNKIILHVFTGGMDRSNASWNVSHSSSPVRAVAKHTLCVAKHTLCVAKHTLCVAKHTLCVAKHTLCVAKHTLCVVNRPTTAQPSFINGSRLHVPRPAAPTTFQANPARRTLK
jgi:hypothetical protein